MKSWIYGQNRKANWLSIRKQWVILGQSGLFGHARDCWNTSMQQWMMVHACLCWTNYKEGGGGNKNMSNHQTRRELSSHEWYTQRRAFSATNYWWLSFNNAQIEQFESDFHVKLVGSNPNTANNECKLRLLLELTALTLVRQRWEILAVCQSCGMNMSTISAYSGTRCTLSACS